MAEHMVRGAFAAEVDVVDDELPVNDVGVCATEGPDDVNEDVAGVPEAADGVVEGTSTPVKVENVLKSEATEIGIVSGGNVGITGLVCPPMTTSHAATSPALSTQPRMVFVEDASRKRGKPITTDHVVASTSLGANHLG